MCGHVELWTLPAASVQVRTARAPPVPACFTRSCDMSRVWLVGRFSPRVLWSFTARRAEAPATEVLLAGLRFARHRRGPRSSSAHTVLHGTGPDRTPQRSANSSTISSP